MVYYGYESSAIFGLRGMYLEDQGEDHPRAQKHAATVVQPVLSGPCLCGGASSKYENHSTVYLDTRGAHDVI